MVILLIRLMRTYRTIIRPNHLHIYISRSYSELLPEVDDSITNVLNHRTKILIKNTTLDDARMMFDKSEDKNIVTWNLMLNGYVKGNDIVKARQLFDEMPERDSVSWNTLISGYLSCKCLEEGRVLFNEMPCRDIVSWNTMISGYAENERMDEAWKLFDQAPSRNVVTWNAMITGFLQKGDLRNAFCFFREMPEQNAACLSALVCALVQKGELDEAQKILLESSCKNDERDDMVHAYNTLIGGYGRRGRIEDARRLFDLIPYYHDERPAKFKRNVVSWNTMIMCYLKAKDVSSARVLFDKMKERDTLTWNTMIDGYIKMSNMEAASYLLDKMPNPSVYTYKSLISGFSRMGKVEEAREFLERMPARDQVSWNLVLSGYVRQGEIVKARQMFDEGVEKDVVSWNTMISGYVCCRNLEEGRKLFDLMPCRDTISWNTMISGYTKIGRMNEAWKLFDQMPNRNVVSWNAMVSGYLQNGDFRSAVRLFKKMPDRDSASLSALVSGLVQNGKLDKAGTILLEISCENDDRLDLVHAYNTLIAGYGRIGRIEDARRFFDRIPCGNNQMRSDRFKRNLVSWNIMIMSYVKAKDVLSARTLFDQMTERDTYSWNTMINGYIEKCDIEEACSLIVKMPNPDVYTWNSLLSGYSQMSELEKARELFERMTQRNRVSWNTIIAAYDKNKQYREAIDLFINMQLEGEKPDRHTLSSLLSACAEIADIHLGMQIHQQVTKFFTPDVPLNNSLITMYARCGAIMEARAIFEEMKLCKDVISWNAMIGGYASHGYATKALELFASMKEVSMKPTYITFISVLNACANAGLAEEGRMHFNYMVNEFGLKPRVEHYATLVDMVGRNGQLEEAMDVIKGMVVEPDKAVWGALLGACKVHNNIKLARVAAEALIRLEPESSTAYVLLHNMYADIGQWEDATEIRMLMEKHNIRKSAGYSLVDSSST